VIITSHQDGQGIKSQFLWHGFISTHALQNKQNMHLTLSSCNMDEMDFPRS